MDVFTVIDRLLFREVAKALAVILFVLALVLVATSLVKLLGKVAAGSLSNELVFILAGLELVKVMGMLMPPAFFFSILWVLGRMYRDSEMVALQAAGLGTWRIYRSFLFSALPLALLVAWLMMDVLPWAKIYSAQVKKTEQEAGQLTGLRAGHFNEFSRGKLVVYAESVDKEAGTLHNLFVQHKLSERPGLITAAGARQSLDPKTGDRYVVLSQGHRYEERGKEGFAFGDFVEYGFRIPSLPPLDVTKLPLSAKDGGELLDSDNPADWAEFQYRLSFPLAVLAFAFVSIPLSRSLPRGGIYGRLGLAILVYFIFMNLQRVAEGWLAKGMTPIWLGMWWLPLMLVLIAGLVMFWDRLAFTRPLRRTVS